MLSTENHSSGCVFLCISVFFITIHSFLLYLCCFILLYLSHKTRTNGSLAQQNAPKGRETQKIKIIKPNAQFNSKKRQQTFANINAALKGNSTKQQCCEISFVQFGLEKMF